MAPREDGMMLQSRAEPAAFFDALAEMHARAAASVGGTVDRMLSLAGYSIRLSFAGPGLVDALWPALSHLETSACRPPDFTILMGDSASTGTAMPHAPWRPEDHREAGEIRGYCGHGFFTVYQFHSDLLTMLDETRATAVYWARNRSALHVGERAAPLRALLNKWAAGIGWVLAHGGAVGTDDGAVLLAGPGGSGKSNTSLACAAQGMRYLSDDYCLLSPDPSPTVHSVYATGKLFPHDVAHLPYYDQARHAHRPPDSDKLLIQLPEWCDGARPLMMPLRAILLPCVTGLRNTSIEESSPAAALRALAPSTIILSPSTGGENLQRLGRLVRSLPCLALKLGTERMQIPHVIKHWLNGQKS